MVDPSHLTQPSVVLTSADQISDPILEMLIVRIDFSEVRFA
jgi:hypothetical protein